MAKSRKTLKIEILLEYANGYLASDYEGGDSEEAKMRRKGVSDLLEAALFSADRYRGFRYLNQKAITKCQPGIREYEDGSRGFFNTDDTRRMYI